MRRRLYIRYRLLQKQLVSENVRLKANSDLLDRAGWKPVERSEVTEVTDLQNMTTEELQVELDALLCK